MRPRATNLALPASVVIALSVVTQVHAERLPTRTYTSVDGLAHDRVRRIVQDSRGFLWFATTDGVSRFDGQRFVTLGVGPLFREANVNDFVEAPDGTYWAATNGAGVWRFDPAGGRRCAGAAQTAPLGGETPVDPRFTFFAVGNDASTNRVNVLHYDQAGVLWAGTDAGLFALPAGDRCGTFTRRRMGFWEVRERLIQVRGFAEDGAGRLWVASSAGLVCRLASGRPIVYSILPAQDVDQVRAVIVHGDLIGIGHDDGFLLLNPSPGIREPTLRVVIRRQAGGVCQPSAGTACLFTAIDWRAQGGVIALCRARTGELWIGTFRGALSFDGRQFRSYADKGLPADRILAFGEDRDGNVWIGTAGNGVTRLSRHGLTTYAVSETGRTEGVVSIFEGVDGHVYAIGGGWFVNRFDGGRFTAARLNVPADAVAGMDWYPRTMQARDGEWWVPARTALYRFPSVSSVAALPRSAPKGVYTTRDGLARNDVYKLFEDHRGDIWIGTASPAQDVVTRWDRATQTFHRYSGSGLPAFGAAFSFAEDRTRSLWIGFYNGGVARYRGGRFELFTERDGVPSGPIRALHVDAAGRLWIASTQSGVARVDDPAALHPRFIAFTTMHGLSSNNARALTEDAEGRIYIGTSQGIDRLDLSSGRIRRYTAADGLARGEVQAAFRDRDGYLWFSTRDGLSRLAPTADPPRAAPSIFISAVTVAGVPVFSAELGARELPPLDFGAGSSSVAIEFFGLSAAPGEALRYEYMLDGSDRRWSAPTVQRTIAYGALASGRYRFLVRAVAADGAVSDEPASVQFRVQPPVWRRWWFVALVAGSLGALAWAIVRARIARLLELERVRTRIAADLHDDIGSTLSQIAILSEVARREVDGRAESAAPPLTKIATLSRELVDAMSDIVWAVNPHRDSQRDLAQRMRRFASDLLAARDVDFSFAAPGVDVDLPIPVEVRRELFLIFKEAVNNAVRHSRCARVGIELARDGRWLTLRVADDGTGFEPRDGGGHGLASMRRRAEDLGGSLRIVSSDESGTVLEVRVPDRPARARGGRRSANRDDIAPSSR